MKERLSVKEYGSLILDLDNLEPVKGPFNVKKMIEKIDNEKTTGNEVNV